MIEFRPVDRQYWMVFSGETYLGKLFQTLIGSLPMPSHRWTFVTASDHKRHHLGAVDFEQAKKATMEVLGMRKPTDREIFIALEQSAPKLGLLLNKGRVLLKNEVWVFNAINAIMNLVYKEKDRFNKSFWTTLAFGFIKPILYIAAPIHYKLKDLRQWWTLAHELGHGLQAKKWTPLVFDYLYLWPLSQGIFLIFTCWLPVFWASGWSLVIWIVSWVVLAGLHFIPKWPDPWRVRWELQCYCISMYFYHQMTGAITVQYIKKLTDLFVGMAYYQMAMSRTRMHRKLMAEAALIDRGEHPVKNHPVVKMVEELREAA
jgi:hypothetical protein